MVRPYACPLTSAEHERNGRLGTLLAAPPFADSAIWRDRRALSGALAHSAAVLGYQMACRGTRYDGRVRAGIAGDRARPAQQRTEEARWR